MPEGQPLSQTSALRLITLGGAALVAPPGDDDAERTLLGPGKPLALLTYLALTPGRLVSREYLTDLLWADLEPDRARHALRQALWYVRQLLGDQSVVGKGDEIRLGTPIESDRDGFLQAVEERDLERAVALYAGPFLPGFAAPGGAEFETWAEGERTRLRKVFVRTAETVVRRLLTISHTREAQQLARRVRDTDPLDERGWRLLIEAQLSAGDLLSARLEAESLETLLEGEGRQPEPATASVLRNARQEAARPAAEASGLAADLIGREQEFAAILEHWERVQHGTTAHLHLSATAGLGKTRLLNDVHARLAATGARAVLVRANPGDRQITYASAAELARVLGELPGAAGVSPSSAGALLALSPSLSGRLHAPLDTSTGEEALRRRTAALTELLAVVSDERPLAILFDDLHWLDAHSRRMLRAVFERLEPHRILLLTAARPSAGNMEGTGTLRLSLRPLTGTQIADLLRSLGRLPDQGWALRLPGMLETASGGSPLLVMEALQLALERGALALSEDGWLCPDGGSALERELESGAALRRRVERLTAEARRALLALSVAGAPLEIGTLTEVTGLTPGAVESTLLLLEQRGFASRGEHAWQTAHDEIAERSVASAGEGEVAVMHGTLGRVLSRAGNSARSLQQAAHHLHAAEDREGLKHAFARYCREMRRTGDWRRTRELAHEFLGEGMSEPEVVWLARSLPLPVKLRASRLIWPLAAAVTLLLGVSTVLLAFRDRSTSADDLLLVRLPSGQTWQVPLSRSTWREDQPLRPEREGTRLAGAALPPAEPEIRASPDGRQWLISQPSPDSGGQDLYLRKANGAVVRLTSARGDDDMGSFSPDGRQIVFPTARWNPAGWSDLAILDLGTGTVRRLTRGNGYDTGPLWSPDGSRIAFSRSLVVGVQETQVTTCWTTPDGDGPHCAPQGPGERPTTLAWLDQDHTILQKRGSGPGLVSYDMGTGREQMLLPQVSLAWTSPNGQWTACLCRPRPAAEFGAYVFPTGRPGDIRRVLLANTVPAAMQFIWQPIRPSPWLDTVRSEVPDGPVPVDGQFALRAHGRTNTGQPADLEALWWRSLNPEVAWVDSASGLLHPLREGTARVIASAGGWRADTLAVAIGPQTSKVVLRENWDEGLAAHWRPFGDPQPEIIRQGDEFYFWNAGDSSFYSGAYTREAWDASQGLGLEGTFRNRITEIHWQVADMELTGALDPAALASWDHRTGWLPILSSWMPARTCGAAYPHGEGVTGPLRFTQSAAGSQHSARVPPETAAGASTTIRIQIFPDRRCGIALNGTPVWISDAPLDLAAPYRVLVQGMSWHTKVLTGPVTVWTGVRYDVDWDALEAEEKGNGNGE